MAYPEYPETKEEWWRILNENWDNMKHIIIRYYPRKYAKTKEYWSDIVERPEKARLSIVESIRENCEFLSEEELTEKVEKMRRERDSTLANVLDDTWFGVPESRGCADSTPGFYTLCNLCSGSYVLYEKGE